MNTIPLFNKKAIELGFLSLILVSIFVGWGYYKNNKWLPQNKTALAIHHTAYAIYKHNSFFYIYDAGLYFKNGLLQQNKESSKTPVGKHLVTESIGFSVLMGLIWKIMGSPNILWIQLLSILLFLFFMLFIYQIGYFLLKTEKLAVLSSLSFLFFFPLIFYVGQGRKDIFAFFGIVVLLFTMLRVAFQSKNLKEAFIGGVFIALFQWVRPTIVAVVFACSGIFVLYFFIKKNKLFLHLAGVIFLTNIIFFWIPFCSYNQYYYHRPMVGTLGLELLESLGEFPNKWGCDSTDTWARNFTYKHKNPSYQYGTPEHDDIQQELFWEIFNDNPWYYFKCVFKRIQKLLFLNFSWFEYDDSLYQGRISFKDRFLLSLSSWRVALDFFPRAFYMRIYWMLAYIGILFAFMRKKYFMLTLLIGGVMAPMPLVILSHIEDRYVLVHFWVLSFFVAYALDQMYVSYKTGFLNMICKK